MPNLDVYLNSAPYLAYVAAFFGGVAASATPCVYPMIPITVAYVGGHSHGSHSRAFLLSLCYVFGIAITYSALGAIAALTGQLFGRIATHPASLVVLAAVFVLMGLNMLDIYQLPLPERLQALRPSKESPGYGGAIIVGLVAGLAAGPCTAPVLAVILAYVARGQNVFMGMSLLFTFAMGLGLLFLVVGAFSGSLLALPKSGPWMVWVKKIFGGVIIGFGGFFLVQAAMKIWG